MKKNPIWSYAAIALVSLLVRGSAAARAEGTPPAGESQPAASLDDQLKTLDLPTNEAPLAEGTSSVSEKLYSVQPRYSSLTLRHEILFGAGRNFTSDGFISSNELEGGYRFHFSPRWSLGVAAATIANSMTSAGHQLHDSTGLVPDASFTKYRGDMTVGFNSFYGKFRLSLDHVFYFDQYFLLGPGYMVQSWGGTPAAVAEAGIALWLGQWGSARISLRDYFHPEKRSFSQSDIHDLIGSFQVGFFLGKGAGT